MDEKNASCSERMRYWKYRILVVVLGCLWSCKNDTAPPKITIAVAANMQYAIQEISKKFTSQTGIECAVVVSASGVLTAQLRQGAPYDLFVAANMKYPTTVYEQGLAIAPPKAYAYGQLVLWSMQDGIPLTMASLLDEKVKHIAIANPDTAPYGAATVAALQKAGVYDRITHKLVYGESIAQTNQFIVSGAATIGCTAQSAVRSPMLKDKGTWQLVATSLYTPITQGVVQLQRPATQAVLSTQFYDFLFSADAREILEDFGYLVPEL